MKVPGSVEVVSKLTHTSKRYEKLRSLFEFFSKSAAALAAKDSPVSGIGHSDDLGRNRFDIEFCGKIYRFSFRMGNKKGEVTCSVLSPDSAADSISIGSFGFSGTGDTDVTGGEDLLNLQSRGDCAQLVLGMISQDFAD